MKLPRNIAGYVHESSLYSCHWNENYEGRGGKKKKKKKEKGRRRKIDKDRGEKTFSCNSKFSSRDDSSRVKFIR